MKKYFMMVLTFLIMFTAVGCSNNDEKKVVKEFLVNVYEVSETGDEVYENSSRLFPNDGYTNAMKKLFSTEGFEDYKVNRSGLKMISQVSELMATTKLEDLVINKYGKKVGVDTCYEFKGKIRFDYMYGDDSFVKDINGQITVGKDEESGKILIKKLNKLPVPDDAEYVHNDDIIGTWKVENIDNQEESDEVTAVLKMRWIFGEDALTMKNGENGSSMDVDYILLDKNRIDIFISEEGESRQMYEYSLEGDSLIINKFKEDGALTFKRINK